jgi:hypothetical protein
MRVKHVPDGPCANLPIVHDEVAAVALAAASLSWT